MRAGHAGINDISDLDIGHTSLLKASSFECATNDFKVASLIGRSVRGHGQGSAQSIISAGVIVFANV